MKNLILVLMAVVAAFAAQDATAGETKREVISVAQFKKETKTQLDSVFTEGELEDIGGVCTVGLVEQNERLFVELTAEGFDLKIPVELSQSIVVKRENESDGSAVLTYQFGQKRELKVIHADDSYDLASLKVGRTQLTCMMQY